MEAEEQEKEENRKKTTTKKVNMLQSTDYRKK